MSNIRSWFELMMAVSLLACNGREGDAKNDSWTLCRVNSDCVLAAASCCTACGEPRLEEVDAVNERLLDEHYRQVCPMPGGCPACATDPNPDLHATCTLKRCEAIDIRTHAASSCIRDDDCRVRAAGCCECGAATDPWSLIATSRNMESRYVELACDPQQGCPECAPIYPTDTEAYCAADGHCALRGTTQSR